VSYHNDIFVSYRRHEETRRWINEHFVPLLELRVGLELGRKPDVFVDTQLESGASWPKQLGEALGRSRTLIALWSGNYLASEWCAMELSHMLDREQWAGLRKTGSGFGLVIPATIHDGETLPDALKHIQAFDLKNCFNVRMARNSPRAEELDAELTAQAAAIATCVRGAPQWRKAWPQKAASTFFKQLKARSATRPVLPKFTA